MEFYLCNIVMLKIALEYKEAFSRFHLKDNYTYCPTRDEWNHIETLCNCLKQFFDVTELLSNSNYCTANLLSEEFCEVLLLLNELVNSSDNVIVQMATEMRKFMKYWLKANKLFTVAAFLDPRYKLVAIEFYYNMIYGNDCARRLNNITSLIKKLFDEYSSRNNERSQSSCNAKVSSSYSQRAEHVGQKRKSRFAEYMETCQSGPAKTDLEIYMEEGVIRWDENTMGKLDILAWWRGNIGKYPALSRIARDVFCVPVSTVVSESTFSTGGRVIHCHRSRMKKETIEVLILAQDWLRAEDGESKLPLFSKDVVNEDPSKEDEYVVLMPTILGNDEVDEYGSEVIEDDY